jgi:predicted transcriptional regulator with HTH domain
MEEAPVQARDTARRALEEAFASKVAINPDLGRGLVSFQADKKEPFYRWFKYKEAFSSALVQYVQEKLANRKGVLLDPFAGTGTALFAARLAGWDAIGIEVLPVPFYAIEARAAAEKVDPRLFADQVDRCGRVRFSDYHDPRYDFGHIAITRGAFSPATEGEMAGFRCFCETQVHDRRARKLLLFACFCILEEISFTRKDGQYLRWDRRSSRPELHSDFNKGRIPGFREAIMKKLDRMAADLASIQARGRAGGAPTGRLDVRKGSCLGLLPQMPDESVDFVLTSPPYCNRYDYTRTYALELAYLGYSDTQVKALRQAMLSCTVENKEKVAELKGIYGNAGAADRFNAVQNVFDCQEALQEVVRLLEGYRMLRKLNNSNISRMVRNYFYEMCFVVCELSRVLRSGAVAVMVNDNVQYAGETIPVDLILSDFARSFGLRVRHIWTLPRGKGNSSQQMGSHGRRELRKCVYVWEKPA